MSDNEVFDDMLTHMASKAGGIKALLDTFFSFLERKTDFYVQFDPADKQHTGGYSMGFPKGVAEKMVLQAFRQYRVKDYEQVVTTPMKAAKAQNASNSNPTTTAKSSTKTVQSSTELPPAPSTPLKTPKQSATGAVPPSTPVTKTPLQSQLQPPMTPSFTPEGKQIPIGNGGVGEGYYWTQTLKDVTVYIDTAAGCRSKEVKCNIKAQHLLVEVRGEVLLNGVLEDVVKVAESMWTISSTTDAALQQIVITLDKTRPTWWKHVITGHSEIDTSKASCMFLLMRRIETAVE